MFLEFCIPTLAQAVPPTIVTTGSTPYENSKEKKPSTENAELIKLDTDKTLLRSVSASGTNATVLNEILNSSYLYQKDMSPNAASASQTHAEEVGPVKSRIADCGGEPVLTWRTSFRFES